ncbi:MAG: hypothetical protein MRECE_57c002 [Mycoplasmataceae bacterium CE_OT135]|nr:MAG: hypothetical protein MRECE_57c002 [Mycoplasmataceae bacterium CE_OT135]
MSKETKTFEFKDLKFKRISDSKIVSFDKKQVEIEVKWEGSHGKGEKEIVLEKDSKIYRLAIRLELESRAWRDTIKSINFATPPNADYQYLNHPPAHRTAEGIGWEQDWERVEELRLTRPWKTGRIVGVGIFVLVVIGALGFILWKKKVKSQKIPKFHP